MNEPKCPYCGVEMVHTEPRIHTNRNGIGVRWQCRYFCPSCHSYAPMMDLDCHSESTIIQAARNAALCAQQERENPKPITNAERIRAMSDEELALWLCDLFSVDTCYTHCPGCDSCNDAGGLSNGLKKWLQQPAEEG